jgi:hypothetical protein
MNISEYPAQSINDMAMEILGQDLLRQKSLMMTTMHSAQLEDLSNY